MEPGRRFRSTYRWQKLRALQLRGQPYCEDAGPDCAGPLEADHIVPVALGGEPFALSNLTTRCRRHNAGRGVGGA
jgi:hypothetical protein